MKIYITLAMVIVLVSLVQATTTCTPSALTMNHIKGEFVSSKTIQCTNNDQNSSVTFSKSGDFFSSDTPANALLTPFTKTIILTFTQNLSAGNYQGTITTSDSTSVPVTLTITQPEEEPEDGCRLIELPHTTNYRIKQGEKGASNQIRIKVSTDCKNPLTMSVNEETQMSKPMFLQGSSGDIEPGGEFSFNIGLDATGVSTGTYQNSYTVSGNTGDNIYKKTIFLTTVVTISENPVTNETFSKLPACTLDSALNLNQTYKLTCNNENPNIDIEIPYNVFFNGVSVSESEGKFEYIFQPRTIGKTDFVALFKYKKVPIGTPFVKEVTITSNSIASSGAELKAIFYQEDIQTQLESLAKGSTRLLIVDNGTNTAISSYRLLLNGLDINNTFEILPDKTYDLRVSSTGYRDLVVTFRINQTPIIFNIIPLKSFYYTGESISFNSSVNDTKYLANDILITNPYSLTSSGNITIKAVKDGFVSANQTIQVIDHVYVLSSTPTTSEWKKGEEIIISLSKNVSWTVLNEGIAISSGNGNIIEFKIDDYGTIDIQAESISLLSQKIEKKFSWMNPLTWGMWLYPAIGATLLVSYLIFFRKGNSDENIKYS